MPNGQPLAEVARRIARTGMRPGLLTSWLSAWPSGAGLLEELLHGLAALREDLEGQPADLGGVRAPALVEAGRLDRADLRREEARLRGAMGDHDVALVELHAVVRVAHVLRRGDEGVQVVLQRRVPHSVIDQERPLRVHALLELDFVLRQAVLLQVAVELDQDVRGRRLVNLAALQVHDAVFEHVNQPDARRAGDDVQLADQRVEGHLLAVQRHGSPARNWMST